MSKESFKYKELKEEVQRYQEVTEAKIQELSETNIKLEKSLDALSNIVEVSKYVNSFLSSKNLIPKINDMIIGILGVTYCTIYIVEDNKLVVKASNRQVGTTYLTGECNKFIEEEKTFTINSSESIISCKENLDDDIKINSRMGVPIKIRDKFIGYIILDHTHHNFFNCDHETFVNTISSQIAIAIENAMLYREIRNSAKLDPLIGIYNRKTFFSVLQGNLKESNEKYAIVMIDLDDFKIINDTLGHQFGDEILINAGLLIRDQLDSKDIIARYGGEEIIVYINDATSEEMVFNKIEKIRKSIEQSEVKKNGITKGVTASFGISFYPSDGTNLLELIKLADEQLYKAKYSGKNKVMSSHNLRKNNI